MNFKAFRQGIAYIRPRRSYKNLTERISVERILKRRTEICLIPAGVLPTRRMNRMSAGQTGENLERTKAFRTYVAFARRRQHVW